MKFDPNLQSNLMMDNAPKLGLNLAAKLASKIWLNLRAVLLNLDADNGGKFDLYASYYLWFFSKGIMKFICLSISSACLDVKLSTDETL